MPTAYKNTYQRAPPLSEEEIHRYDSTPADEYDHYFCFDVASLCTDRVELRPYTVSVVTVIKPDR